MPSPPPTKTVRQPASERVAALLAERIRGGLYPAGELLPTERALAADLGVHRRSVRAAVNHLVQDGLVSRRPNRRPMVERAAAQKRPADAQAARLSPARFSASNLIALIMWHGGGPLEHAGTSQQRIFWGMNQALARAGCHAVFLDLGDVLRPEQEIAAQEAEHLRYVRDQGFGGALFYPYAYRHNRALVEEVSRSVPLVLLDRKTSGLAFNNLACDFVGTENRGAMFDVTRHLLAQGHRRIAYVTHQEPIHPVQDRLQGYLDAMREGNGPDRTEMILTLPDYGDARDWTVPDAVFQLPEGQRPTAAACFTDYSAVKVAERLERLGLSVPRQVALTGFDDIVPALPGGLGLTTAAQPYEEIGTTAVELLLRRIRDPLAPPRLVQLPARLVVRASSLR